MGPGERYSDNSPAHTRSVQHSRRLRIEVGERSLRLETGSGSVPENQSSSWPTGSEPVCLSTHSPIASVLQLEVGPSIGSRGCISAGLEDSEKICQSTLVSDWTCTQQDKAQEAQVILVAPVWKGQVWYPVLLEMLRDFPWLIHPQESLLQRAGAQRIPEIIPQLAVWPVSGKDTETASFLQKLQTSCLPPGGRSPCNHMSLTLASGLAGVQNGVTIPFQDL